jgi:hypothetical protein
MPVLRAHADDAPALLEQIGGCLNELTDCVMELRGPDPYGVCWLDASALRCARFDCGRMAATLRRPMPSV